MHFMNPVPVMQLVEVIRGIATSRRDVRGGRGSCARTMGKTPVEVNDFPGFVSNRVLMPMINEAIFAVYEGVGTPEAIDTVMKLGMNHPMGPLTLADFIGLDTCLAILRVLHDGLGDPKYRPCPLLVQMVDAGWLGKKSGRGFYRYSGPGGEQVRLALPVCGAANESTRSSARKCQTSSSWSPARARPPRRGVRGRARERLSLDEHLLERVSDPRGGGQAHAETLARP